MDYRIDQIRSQLREDPSSRLFYKLGELFRREGEPEKAIEVLENGLEHHPRYVAAWVALGRAQLALDQFAEAESSFAQALEIDPDNAVAARMIGESAAGRGDWVRAIKALKLARALSPGDEELEDRISEAEGHLADAGLLEAAPGAVSPAEGGIKTAGDPNAITLEDPFIAMRPAVAPEVVTVAGADEDPFAITQGGDSGVWRLGDEVFAEPSEPAPDGALVDAAEAIPGPPEAGPDAAAAEGVAVTEQAEVPPPAAAGEPPAAGDVERIEAHETVPGELPLPTLTLARLALDQGDPELAEKTLRSLLVRHPENTKAGELLRQVERQMTGVEPAADLTALAAAKIATLRGWLDAVRLAAER